MSLRLYQETPRFSFFQAVRLLTLIYRGREPLGTTPDPSREVVRFRTRVSLEFPPSELYELKDGAEGRPPELTVSFFGLTGPVGAMPQPYTELLVERTRYKDTALWAFLDLFNHRMLSLFYRAWEKYRFPIGYERGGRRDPFTDALHSLIGLGTAGLQGRMAVPDHALLPYAGLIALRPHSASAVSSILSDYFDAPITVEPYQGQWLALAEEDQTRLGAKNSTLGSDALIGSRVFDRQSKFRLRAGPLTLRQLEGFLPAGGAFKPLHEMTRFLVGQELDFDVQLVLSRKEVPPCRLGEPASARLGWTSWLTSRPVNADSGDVVLAAAA